MTSAQDTGLTGDIETNTATVTLRYFAWVREKVGLAEEQVTLPTHVTTVSELIEWLQNRDETYAAAFAKPEVIRTAIDQNHVQPSAALGQAREIAFFPPVTGG